MRIVEFTQYAGQQMVELGRVLGARHHGTVTVAQLVPVEIEAPEVGIALVEGFSELREHSEPLFIDGIERGRIAG